MIHDKYIYIENSMNEARDTKSRKEIKKKLCHTQKKLELKLKLELNKSQGLHKTY